MLASAGNSFILGEDRCSRWRAMGPDWARFVSFWSKPNSHNGFQHEYPYVLELQLSDNIKDQFSSLASLSTASILVTQSHADLYERIKTGLKLDIIEDNGMRPPPLRNGVIITGQPGTGKSVCLWYIAIRHLQDYPLEPLLIMQQDIVVLLYRGTAYTLPESQLPINPMQLPVQIFPLKNEHSCIALIDSVNSDPPEYLGWGSILLPIFATFPDFRRTKHFMKIRDPYVWGMPTWTLLELRKGFELQSDFARIKENLIALEPGINFDDWLPLRAKPEVETSSPTKVMERYLGKFVESAVQHVGWVPRDVYHFMVRPTSHGLTFPSSQSVDLSQMLLELIGPLKMVMSPLAYQVFMLHALPQNDLKNTRFILSFRTKGAENFFIEGLDWPNLLEVLRIIKRYREAHSLGSSVFEAVAHKVLPTFVGVPLIQMRENPTKEKAETFIRYLAVDTLDSLTSPKTIRVDFAQTAIASFEFSAPQRIQLSYYYKGCRTTPIIDGFFLSKTQARITLYLLRITTSQKKGFHTLINGSQLITDIIAEVERTYQLPLSVRFVLVGLVGDVFTVQPEQSWELPHPDILGFPYEVYQCELPIPDNEPILGTQQECTSDYHSDPEVNRSGKRAKRSKNKRSKR